MGKGNRKRFASFLDGVVLTESGGRVISYLFSSLRASCVIAFSLSLWERGTGRGILRIFWLQSSIASLRNQDHDYAICSILAS